MPTIPDTELNRYRVRFLEQLITDASATHWERRAAAFDAARPRPGDYHGRATQAELAERDRRCRETAAACRAHAALLRQVHGLPGAAREALMILSESETAR